MMAEGMAQIAADHGMPIDTRERPRMAGTLPACRAVVAARIHAPDREGPDAGLDAAELARWMDEPEVQLAVEEDAVAARRPMPAARALDHKLANWSGGRRYTCPSYEIERAGERPVTIAVPGFQPFAVYDVVMANLCPELERREDPGSVEEALAWAGEPLATAEVAEVCAISRPEAEQELARVAERRPLGTDAFWTLAA
jgi:hypothetical protein